jgi:hypothetical protein
VNGNRNGSIAQKYGVNAPNFSAIEGTQQYTDDATVNPYSAQNRTTVDRQTAWRGGLGAQSGQGTFLNFGSSSTPQMPRSVGS